MSANSDWVTKYQDPFDKLMRTSMDPTQHNAAMQQYLSDIASYGSQGSNQAKTAAGARDTFNKYYQFEDPASGGVGDPWAGISDAYGLGAPPAQGLPSTMPGVQIGEAPQAQANLLDTSAIPQPQAQQMGVSDEIKVMANGQGYSPDTLAKMKANAVQNAATAGTQQMGQTKRLLGANGISGGANAAVLSDVARQTGQNQSNVLGQIDVNNAQVGNENAKFGIGQETNIGQNNMQAANTMALQNANTLFQGMQANQSANNQATQLNTGLKFQRQENQAGMDFNTQKSQWDELNKRYGQSQNILGSWGQAA